MKKKQNQRWRLIADVRLQGLLCVRLAVYWMVCQATMVGTISAMSILTSGSTTGSSSGNHFIIPALTVSSLVFPILLFDMLLFSNRFAGPMVSFRRQLRRFAKNGKSDRIKFRSGDFYQDISDNYNKICESIETERRESSGTSKHRNRLPPLEATNSIGSENHV